MDTDDVSIVMASTMATPCSEPQRIPVIVHTASFGYDSSYDSAYESRSDSESSNSSSLDIASSPSPPREVECKWIDCGQSFAHLDELAAHVTSLHAHTGPGGLFFCGWEGCTRGERGFNARYKMLVHVRTHTNEKPHRCCQCDKSFSRAENLKIHARSHTGERPYVCPVPGCGKAYSNSSDRFKHTRTHSVDKPYICKVPGCGKKYTDPSSLRKHVKTYRHFPATPETVKTELQFEDDMEHEQIVPEAAPHHEQEAYTYPYPYSIPDVSGYVGTWFGADLAHGFNWEQSRLWTSQSDVKFLIAEQEMPLDLTVHK